MFLKFEYFLSYIIFCLTSSFTGGEVDQKRVIPVVLTAWKCNLATGKMQSAWGQMPRSEGKCYSIQVKLFKSVVSWYEVKQKLENKINWVVVPNRWHKTKPISSIHVS